MKKLFLFILLITSFQLSKAQNIDSSIIENYSSSVIIRVHDIASKITIPVSLQQALANLFTDEENDISGLIINGASSNTLDSVKNSYKIAFHNLLSAEQRDDYYNITNAPKVNTTARLTSLALRNKYKTGIKYQDMFNQILLWREQRINLAWSKNVDTTIRNNNLYNTIWAYDSLLALYTHAASGYQYLNTRLHYLDSIKSIDTPSKQALAENYYNLCISNPNRSFADNFKSAMNIVFNQITDTPYYSALYANQINYSAQQSSANAIVNYAKRDNVSQATIQQITEFIIKREYTTALLHLMYPSFSVAKDSLIDTLTFVYQQQINELIGNGASLINPSQIDIALHYATELQLDNSKIPQLQDALTLLHNNQEQYKANNEFGEYDSKAFESQVLSSILSADQYTQVLTTKYAHIATNMANRIWLYMQQKNRTNGLVETDVKTELTNYYLAIIIAHYRNAHNPEIQFTSVASIRELMPTYLYTLIKEWEYKSPYNDTPDTFFQW